MVSHLRLIAAAITLFIAVKGFTEKSPKKVDFPKREITLVNGKHQKKLIIEIAKSEAQHEYGLMNRTKLGKDEGMLFIFDDESIRSFWMKNTLINLSIGYFDKSKKLIDIQEMTAVTSILQTEIPNYPSRGPAQYALEMPEGWFNKNKMTTGTLLIIK
jgi:uncharacterized protein